MVCQAELSSERTGAPGPVWQQKGSPSPSPSTNGERATFQVGTVYGLLWGDVLWRHRGNYSYCLTPCKLEPVSCLLCR